MSIGLSRISRVLLVLVLLLGAVVDAELLHAHDPLTGSVIDCSGCLASSTAGDLPVPCAPAGNLSLLRETRCVEPPAVPALAPTRRVGVRGPP